MLTARWIAVCVVLGGALSAKTAFFAHLRAGGEPRAAALTAPLDEFPNQIGPWTGSPREIGERDRYGDIQLARNYAHADRPQAVALWMSFSHDAADRGHHPEVCMAVYGKTEDREVRQTLAVPGPGDPIQQFRFRGPNDRQWVFYWHYTLPPNWTPGATPLQKYYQQLRHRPASLTIEVFAPEYSDQDVEHAAQFVREVDALVRELVGPNALRGSQRRAVQVLRPGGV